MKKKILLIISSLILFVFLISCGQIQNLFTPDSNTDILTNPYITIINDQTSLANELETVSQNISIEETTPQLFAKKQTTFTLTLIGQIDSPQINGQTLQATNIQIKGDYALVSYNMQGATYLGAMDIIKIATRKTPELISRILFNDTDTHSLTYEGNTIYLAQAKETTDSDPAQIQTLEFKGNKVTFKNNLTKKLSSYAANSVYANTDALLATTGSAGKLYALNYTTLAIIDSVDLDSARWVLEDDNRIAVVQGLPGRMALYTFNGTSFASSSSFTFTGADVAEAKSQAEIVNDFIFIAAGTGGVQIHNLTDGSKITEIPLPTDTGLDSSVVVSNAVSIDKDLIFISNGEAGVYAAQASKQIKNITNPADLSLTMQGKLQFDSLESVNHVNFKGNYLLVAAGLGGLKIVDVQD
jgi:hypothetical protein